MSEKIFKNQKYDKVRAACVKALILLEQGETLEQAIAKAISDIELRAIDRRFFLQLVNGTIKMRRRLDHEIKFYLAKPSTELPLKLKNILRLGFYQLHFTDRIPDAAAVSESVNLAHFMTDKSKANLVNAVMRSAIREPNKIIFAQKDKDPVKYLGDFYSYPNHFVEYCMNEFGFLATKNLLTYYNEAPRVTYRVNFLKAKPDEVAHLLTKNEVEFSFGKYLPEFLRIESGGLPLESELIKSGKVYVQDESSGMAVRLMNPRPGNSVLDMTAAPGGKTTYAAIRMRNKGRVTAIDKTQERLEILVGNAQRLGIKIISPVISDMYDFKGGPFDRVLLDPPCSGWGSAGKHSDLRWAKTSEDTTKLARIQQSMIGRASKLVKPGGVLVYSTCTIIKEENDMVVEDFLAKHKEFEVESAKEFYPDELVTDKGYVKTYPSVGKLDGSFCVRLKRKEHA